MGEIPGPNIENEINTSKSESEIASTKKIEQTNDSIESPEKRRSFINLAIERATSLIKKPSKKARIVLGLITFFGGVGYIKRDEIMDYGGRAFQQNPITMDLFDLKAQLGHTVTPDRTLNPEDIKAMLPKDNTGEEISTIKIKNSEINIFESINGLENAKRPDDFGPKIEINDFYLKNLLEKNTNCVAEPENEASFREFIKSQIENKEITPNDSYTSDDFKKGDIQTFIRFVTDIVDRNLKYDKRTADWLKETSDGRGSLRWGKSNPALAFLSADRLPVDKLLMQDHRGVCRHFSDCVQLVANEIKKIYPDRFQNIYIVTFANSYQWHEYNLGFVVRGTKEGTKLDAFEIDPQTGSTSSPAYELVKMMYERGIIDQDEYFKTLTDFLKLPKVKEDGEDVCAIIESAQRENRKDVIDVAIKMLIDQSYLKPLQILQEQGLVNNYDYSRAIANSIIHQDNIGPEDIEKAITFSHEHPENSQIIYNAMKEVCLHPDVKKIAGNVYWDMVDDLRNLHILSDEEYIQIGKEEYEKVSYIMDDGKFMDFLLNNNKTLPLAKHYLLKDLNDTMDYPLFLITEYDKKSGEFSRWTKNDFLNEPWSVLNDKLKYGVKQLTRYRELTGEDLSQEALEQMKINMAKLEEHIRKSHFKRTGKTPGL
jgi:hypothetical protein